MKYLGTAPIVFGGYKGDWPFPHEHVPHFEGGRYFCHACKREIVRDSDGWKEKDAQAK